MTPRQSSEGILSVDFNFGLEVNERNDLDKSFHGLLDELLVIDFDVCEMGSGICKVVNESNKVSGFQVCFDSETDK